MQSPTSFTLGFFVAKSSATVPAITTATIGFREIRLLGDKTRNSEAMTANGASRVEVIVVMDNEATAVLALA